MLKNKKALISLTFFFVLSNPPQHYAIGQTMTLETLLFLYLTLYRYFLSIFGPTITLRYVKNDVLPFTEYKFRVVVRNTYGPTYSPWVSIVTLQDSK